MFDTIMTLSYLDKTTTKVEITVEDDEDELVSQGEKYLGSMSEVSKNNEDEFLLAFKQGVPNEVKRYEAEP